MDMKRPLPYSRYLADPPDWMDSEERALREDLMFDMDAALRQQGRLLPAPIGELIASYVGGDMDEDELMRRVHQMNRSTLN